MLLLFTTIGTFLTLAGFICQNIGTRELHWSAGLLQLGTTLILAGLRAWSRRRVGIPPPTVVTLKPGLGASQLACHLEGCTLGIITESEEDTVKEKPVPSTGKETEQQPLSLPKSFGHFSKKIVESKLIPKDLETQQPSSAITERHSMELERILTIHSIHRVLTSQVELGKFEQDGEEISQAAVALCEVIEETLNRHMHGGMQRVFWHQQIAIASNKRRPLDSMCAADHVSPIDGIYHLELTASDHGTPKFKFKVDPLTRQRIQTILSLSMYRFRHENSSRRHIRERCFLRVVGRCRSNEQKDQLKSRHGIFRKWLPVVSTVIRESSGKTRSGECPNDHGDYRAAYWARVFGMQYSFPFQQR